MKVIHIAALAVVALLGVWCQSATAANIEVCPERAYSSETDSSISWKQFCQSAVWISGTIERGDYDKFRELIKKRGGDILTVALADSPGGDLVEAIRIGELVRKLKINTAVGNRFDLLGQTSVSLLTMSGSDPEQSRWTCASACVVIWLSGVSRAGNWKLVVHRPYYDASYFSGLSAEKAEQKYQELEEFTYGYLRRMDTPESLITKMREVPSGDGYVLPLEFVDKKLDGNIPSFDEWLTAKCGKKMSDEDRAHVRSTSSKTHKTAQEQALQDMLTKYEECYVAARVTATNEGRASVFGE